MTALSFMLLFMGSVAVVLGGFVFFDEWTSAVGRAVLRLVPITRVQGLRLPPPADSRWKATLDDDAAEAARRLGTDLPAEYTFGGNVAVRVAANRLLIDPSAELVVDGRALDTTRDDVRAYVQAVHTVQVQRSMERSMKAYTISK